MGFRTGSYATIWSVESATDTRTKARISISRKNKQTGEYDTDFSGFVDFIGTAAARKALSPVVLEETSLHSQSSTINAMQTKQ